MFIDKAVITRIESLRGDVMVIRRFGAALLCMILLGFLSPALAQEQAKVEKIAQFTDAKGDDVGGGNLLYPEHAVYVPGLFDLVRFEVSRDEHYVYFDFQFLALTNPFQAPEGYFHQRLEVYIKTGEGVGCTAIHPGSYKLQTAPDAGWNLRLSIAPFDESRLYVVGQDSQVQVFTEEVSSHSLPEGQTIRVQVKSDVLPQPDSAWGYYVLVGSFDGLAEGLWRDLGDGPWQVGGTGTPVFDLLSPRFGGKSQKAQLTKGILYPVYGGKSYVGIWVVGVVIVAWVCGAFCLWRWRHGRP